MSPLAPMPMTASQLGQLLVHLRLVALPQAAGDHQLFDFALFFQLGQLQDLLDGFLLCALDKAAGVYNGDVRHGGVVHRLEARLLQGGHQHLPVHLVFGAAQADHAYFICHVILSLSLQYIIPLPIPVLL